MQSSWLGIGLIIVVVLVGLIACVILSKNNAQRGASVFAFLSLAIVVIFFYFYSTAFTQKDLLTLFIVFCMFVPIVVYWLVYVIIRAVTGSKTKKAIPSSIPEEQLAGTSAGAGGATAAVASARAYGAVPQQEKAVEVTPADHTPVEVIPRPGEPSVLRPVVPVPAASRKQRASVQSYSDDVAPLKEKTEKDASLVAGTAALAAEGRQRDRREEARPFAGVTEAVAGDKPLAQPADKVKEAVSTPAQQAKATATAAAEKAASVAPAREPAPASSATPVPVPAPVFQPKHSVTKEAAQASEAAKPAPVTGAAKEAAPGPALGLAQQTTTPAPEAAKEPAGGVPEGAVAAASVAAVLGVGASAKAAQAAKAPEEEPAPKQKPAAAPAPEAAPVPQPVPVLAEAEPKPEQAPEPEPSAFQQYQTKAEALKSKDLYAVAGRLYAESADLAEGDQPAHKALFEAIACYLKADMPEEAHRCATKLQADVGKLSPVEALKLDAVLRMT